MEGRADSGTLVDSRCGGGGAECPEGWPPPLTNCKYELQTTNGVLERKGILKPERSHVKSWADENGTDRKQDSQEYLLSLSRGSGYGGSQSQPMTSQGNVPSPFLQGQMSEAAHHSQP